MLKELLRMIFSRGLFKLMSLNKDKSIKNYREKYANKLKIEDLKYNNNEHVIYYNRPFMNEEYIKLIDFFTPRFYCFIPIFTILIILLFLLKENQVQTIWMLILIFIFSYFMILLLKYIKYYNEITCNRFYKEIICVSRFLRKDFIISYEEIKKCLQKKKIRIKAGKIELPYEKGWIPIYVDWERNDKDFYMFLFQKLNLKLPKMNTNRKK